MKNIDIRKIICKELGKPESLTTYVEDRKGARYVTLLIRPRSTMSLMAASRQSLQMELRRRSSGIRTTRSGGETIISGEYQNYYEKMYGNRKEMNNEGSCNRCSRSVGHDVMNELAGRGMRESDQISRKCTADSDGVGRDFMPLCADGYYRCRLCKSA